MNYYNEFNRARLDGNSNIRHILIFDEYPAFINYLQGKDKQDKTKLSNDVLNAIAEILMLGRGFSYGIWIVTQRADSTYFSNGARDNFMIIIALGRISREQKQMLFSGEDLPEMNPRIGEGLLLADGHEIQQIKYPRINNINNWNQGILSILKEDKCRGAV